MLESRAGGEREVDVAISSEVAGHKVTVSVEATASRRPATVEWVERMVKKHESLPTSKLVLVLSLASRPPLGPSQSSKASSPLNPRTSKVQTAAMSS